MKNDNLSGYPNNCIMNRNASSGQAELMSTSQHAEERLTLLRYILCKNSVASTECKHLVKGSV